MEFYNSAEMRDLRTRLLNGESPDHCEQCYYEDSFGKLSGRVRQLYKSAVDINNFDLTIRSSPHFENFKFSNDTDGQSDLNPVDLQIDLGNTCNSACIMCYPTASSKLESDYKKLHKIEPMLFNNPTPYKSWTRNPEAMNSFIDQIADIKNIRYIHFLGGETLFDESFYQICERLIDAGLSKDIIVGTTTNGTIYNNRIQRFIENFKEFHLGISIESISPLNDYIRFPSTVKNILKNIDKFLALRDNSNLFVSLRITPNIFTIYELDKLMEYLIQNKVSAESCNILTEPRHLRMELIPDDIRAEIIDKFEKLIDKHDLKQTNIINTRRSDLIDQSTANLILEYYNFISNFKVPPDAEQSKNELVRSLKAFESIRNNSILDYAPRYENFLRSIGY
jgi:MoaA/NifB/PqqE/SkfB family radical SAM enzyme